MPAWRLAPEEGADFDELNALNLNVFIPLKALKHETKSNPVPVMTWVHGGAFTWGSNADPLYDAVNLVQHSIQLEQPVIVVAINYRVNIFGFLASKELQEELEESPEYPSLSTYERSIGNWGLMDQKLAFEWVRENIASFGGDAKNVTAFGESAGSVSLHYHMVLPSHHGLFDHAILQSGTILSLPPEHMHKEGQANFDTLLERLSIPLSLDSREKMRRLRSIDQLALLSATRSMPGVHYPCYDNGKVFPALSASGLKPYTVLLAARDINAYDPNLRSVLLGSTKDEGTTFPRFFGECSPQTWPAFLRQMVPVPELHAEAERVYGAPTTDADAELIFSKLIGDAGFSYSTHVTSETLQSLQSARGADQFRLLRYNMDVGMNKLDEMQPGLGATHGVELPFVFGAPKLTALLTEEEVRLSKEMQRLWISFAYQRDYEAKAPSNEMRVPQAENGEAFVMTNTHHIEIGKSNRLTEAQRALWDKLAQMQLATTATL
ncbi:Esterase-6 [Mortierella alpina]|uniref:Esterase-6 n=1 Tax=Mortierella alpina TaxID=64518 RepID=A0A9P6J0B8_MORAP|nr:Esterase-6 [Mortierella alpina]